MKTLMCSYCGCSLVRPELALAVQFGLTIENLTSVFLAAQTFDKDVAKLSCCAG